MASRCRRCCFALSLAVALVHEACLEAAVAQGPTNLTAGAALTPPGGYISSPSGDFAFGFRALGSDDNSAKFILATWFRFGSGGNASSSSLPAPESVVWFAKQSVSGDTAVGSAQSVLSVTADGQLALAEAATNRVLWRAPIPRLRRGSVLVLRDSGNLQFLGDSGDVLWDNFWYPTDTLLPGQSLVMDGRSEGKIFSKRADAEFTTGRFSMGIQTDGNVVLYVDLLSGNSPDNAYWQAYTNSPDGNTTVTFDEQGRLNYTLQNGTVQSLISSSAAAGGYYRFARMDPDGIVRVYVHPKAGASNASWTVSGAFPSDGCNKRTSGLQGMCGPGSYCVETKDRLSCVCPTGYTYTDAQHKDSGCTPEFEPEPCDGEADVGNSDEFALVELPNTTWEASIYYKKFLSTTESQCRDYCLSDCYCTTALLIAGTDCVEMAALTNGRQANDVTTKALVKVRTRGGDHGPPAMANARRALPYVVATVCLAFLLLVTIIAVGFLASNHFRKNREKQRLLTTNVRAFSSKELYQATNGFAKLLGKGSFGEVYHGVARSLHPPDIAVKKLINSNEFSEREFANEMLEGSVANAEALPDPPACYMDSSPASR
ncbi:hypothetical protein ABZP36_020592 [Zizania latifolia]